MRALAVITVVLFHGGVDMPGGFVAVDVFFVISGYVITAMLLRQLVRSSRIKIREFYVRRIRRLMPALALMLVGTLLGSALLQSPFGFQQDTAAVGIGASIWTGNIAILGRVGGYFDRAADELPLLHTWSLSVEEQFYLVFPFLLLLAWRLARGRIRTVTLSVLFVSAASFVFSLSTSYDLVDSISSGSQFAYYMTPTRAWEFGAGILVALALHQGYTIAAYIAKPLAIFGLAGLVGCFYWIDSTMPFPGWVALAPVAFTGLLIITGTSGGPVTDLLSCKPMTWIGDRSYGWYLWHWPFIVFASLLWPTSESAVLLAGFVAIVPAWLSYRFVEEPIRRGTFRLRRRTADRPPSTGVVRVAAAAMLLPLLVFLAYGYGTKHHWGNDRLTDAAKQTETYPEGYDEGCHEGGPLPERDLSGCTWHSEYSDTVYLVGDSNAGMYSDGLIEATEQTQQRLIVGARSSCPFILASSHASNLHTADCDEYVDETLTWLTERPPGTVVISAAASEILNDGTTLEDPNTGKVAETAEKKASLWDTALSSVISKLRSAGHDVVVIGVIPHFYNPGGGYWTTAHCALIDFAQSSAQCGATQSRSDADELQSLPLQAEHDAAEQAGASYLDLRDELCPDGVCQTVRDDTFMYRDGKHISKAASAQLAPQLAAAISG